jgi:putative heme iron utilization protein
MSEISMHDAPRTATDHGYGAARPDPVAELPNPTDAERGRTLLESQRLASLATLEETGAPYVSTVQYITGQDGQPVLLLSELAVHTRNARRRDQASLLVTSAVRDGDDPMALPRVTLQGRLEPLGPDPAELARFVAAHPTAAPYASFTDFACWRLVVGSARFVGGYGRMSWVPGQDLLAARADPLAGAAAAIIAHMNSDHADACLTYVRVHAAVADAVAARLVGVDRLGMDLLAERPGVVQPVRVNYGEPAETTDAVRAAVVALLRNRPA